MKVDDFLIWKIESAIKSKSYLQRIHTIVMGIEHLRAEKGLANSDEELSTHSTNKPLTKPNSQSHFTSLLLRKSLQFDFPSQTQVCLTKLSIGLRNWICYKMGLDFNN